MPKDRIGAIGRARAQVAGQAIDLGLGKGEQLVQRQDVQMVVLGGEAESKL